MSRPLSPVAAFVGRLIPGIRYPWLFAMLAGLLVIDLVVPDPVPLLDEIALAVLTFLAASWRTRRGEDPPPPKDVTPDQAPPAALPADGHDTENGTD